MTPGELAAKEGALHDFRHLREQSLQIAAVPDSAQLRPVGTGDWDISDPPRHSLVVRVTHWTFDSLDLPDALHPQTFLAYNLNGEDLPTDHGAPLRLRVARQLGYKSVKYLSRITVTDTMKNIGDGRGSSAPAYGYSWYAGI